MLKFYIILVWNHLSFKWDFNFSESDQFGQRWSTIYTYIWFSPNSFLVPKFKFRQIQKKFLDTCFPGKTDSFQYLPIYGLQDYWLFHKVSILRHNCWLFWRKKVSMSILGHFCLAAEDVVFQNHCIWSAWIYSKTLYRIQKNEEELEIIFQNRQKKISIFLSWPGVIVLEKSIIS